MGCDSCRETVITLWKCDGVVLQAHISREENQLLVVISLLEYLAYKELSCFGGLARVRWNIFYSISESPIQVEVTGRGESSLYPLVNVLHYRVAHTTERRTPSNLLNSTPFSQPRRHDNK
jgi:hypothetical protein